MVQRSHRTNCGVTPADFKTNAGKQLGIKLTRRAPGVGDLKVYFDTAVAMEEKADAECDKCETRFPL